MDRCLLALLLSALSIPAQGTWPLPENMVEVPAGKYRIGVEGKEVKDLAKRLGYAEKAGRLVEHWRSVPSHVHDLPGFFIDRNEVTCAWYAMFLEAHPGVSYPKWWDRGKKRWRDLWPGRKVPAGWENLPVTGITFAEAEMFARWIGRRLPTEFEWESAARYSGAQDDPRYFPWGLAHPGNPILRANSELAHELEDRRTRQPPLLDVGTFGDGRSFLGLHDLAGNAAEMTTSPWIPYPRFKPIELERRRTTNDFDVGNIVVRGGHALHPDLSLTTYFRLGFPRHVRSRFVGFRTAASKTRGKDQVQWLLEDVNVTLAMQNHPLLRSDTRAKRRRPELESEDARQFTALGCGGWNPFDDLPIKAKFVTLVNRRTNDLRSVTALRIAANKEPVLLGVLTLDYRVKKPEMPAGRYLVLWQRRHHADVKLPSGKTERKPVPAAVILKGFGDNKTEVRVEDHLVHLTGKSVGNRLRLADDKRLTCVMSWPSGPGRRALEVVFSLQMGRIQLR